MTTEDSDWTNKLTKKGKKMNLNQKSYLKKFCRSKGIAL